jgi:hypothetical protein
MILSLQFGGGGPYTPQGRRLGLEGAEHHVGRAGGAVLQETTDHRIGISDDRQVGSGCDAFACDDLLVRRELVVKPKARRRVCGGRVGVCGDGNRD